MAEANKSVRLAIILTATAVATYSDEITHADWGPFDFTKPVIIAVAGSAVRASGFSVSSSTTVEAIIDGLLREVEAFTPN